jgi:putative ATP-dependent endonuclease of OLD family
LFKSASLTTLLQNAAKAIHTHTNWDTDFEKVLATKLINKTLKKTAIAYHIANVIDEDLIKVAPTIQIAADADDTINYLVKAIKYATGN